MGSAHTYTGPTSLGATSSPCSEARLIKDSMSNANHFLNPVQPLTYPGLSRNKPVSDTSLNTINGNGHLRVAVKSPKHTDFSMAEKGGR